MPVNIPNPNTYYAQLGQHLIALRVAINNLVEDGVYLNAMGGAVFLESDPFNLNATDAGNIAGIIGIVTPTNPTIQAIQSYLASAVTLTGGN